MLKICALCGKGALTGKVITRKGQYKAKGGTGSKIARWSKRKFLPNLQKMRIIIAGHPRKVYVCTKCVKKGRIQKVQPTNLRSLSIRKFGLHLKNKSLASKRIVSSPSQLSSRGV